MIEIKNISKTYKTKKGLEVAALKNISLNFPDKGMVFVLGKSGSGKSTLLNVLGGLDNYDSGEFLIKGKSSKDFTQADFDSYRNTLIGFIFQDYNILEEFNIGANIALALQLQGKKADSAAVNGILDEVDLTGYGNRKPNELSGGQKQRVAIARALIKSPDIIMADEPTGALDSNTGRQVFDTLKKLSKDKLVIIVSHDREFAEYYGDRVIELKDGEVISDISKYEAPAEVKSEGLKIIDNKVMQLKKGYELTDKDLQLIKNFIKNSETDSFLSLDGRTNENFKQIAMISDDGSKQSFKDTDNEEVAKQSKNEGYQTIRSRLPYMHSLRIGLSSLKVKPIKLIITIILSMAAFAMFGIVDTFATYDSKTATVASFLDSGNNYFNIGRDSLFGDEFVEKINVETELKAKGVYSKHISIYDNLLNSDIEDGAYYSTSIKGIIEMNADEMNEREISLKGRAPQNFYEIVISKYIFETFQERGYIYNNGINNITINKEDIGSEENFLSKSPKIKLGNDAYTIVGIADTKLDPKYNDLKKYENRYELDDKTARFHNSFVGEIENGYHRLGFVYKGTIDLIAQTEIVDVENLDIGQFNKVKLSTYATLSNNAIDFVTKEKTSLADDEIIMSNVDFYNHVISLGGAIYNYAYDTISQEFLAGTYDSYLNADWCGLLQNNVSKPDSGSLKIVGIYNDVNESQIYSEMFVVGNGFYSKFVESRYYSTAIGVMPTKENLEKLVSMSLTEDLSEKINLNSIIIMELYGFDSMADMLTGIFLILGLVVALFAALLLMNFIATSVNYKKQEIGILRAIGAKGIDVFGIFCNESMFIALVNFILATISTFVASYCINLSIRNVLYFPVTLLTVGIRQIALIFGISVVTAFLSSLIPVLKISRKRPIDAIRNR